MQEEIWKDISGYKGKYQVSNHGNVRSLDREVNSGGLGSKNRLSVKKGKQLKNSLTPRGYVRVNLSEESNVKSKLVHSLVAQEFLEKDSERPFVNHIDGNKLNNHISNLEYCNQRENFLHAKIFNKQKEFPYVSYVSKFNRFETSIQVNGKIIKLGRHKTQKDAFNSYLNALEKYGLQNKYTENVILTN
jgi:hypothetical protein